MGRTAVLLGTCALLVLLATAAGPGLLRLVLTLGLTGLLVHLNRLHDSSTRRGRRPGPRSSTRPCEEP